MKTEKNEPGELIFTDGDSWVAFRLRRTKITVDTYDIDGTPLLTLKNIDTLAEWLAETRRKIKSNQKKPREEI